MSLVHPLPKPEPLSPTAAFRLALSSYSYSAPDSPTPLRRSPRKHVPTYKRLPSPPPSPSKRRRVGELRFKLEGDADAEEGEDEKSPKKRRLGSPVKRGYAPPETYAHLRPLQDHLGVGLDVLFCGINPGYMSADTGHHFANPTNHFWRALHLGSFTPTLIPAEEDHTLPTLYNLGLTNLVERPSIEAAELSVKELGESVPAFLEKVGQWRPRVVAFVGKGIWLAVQRGLEARIAEAAAKEEPAKEEPRALSEELGLAEEPARATTAEVEEALEEVKATVKEDEKPDIRPCTPPPSTRKRARATPKSSPRKKAPDDFEYGLQPYLLLLPAEPEQHGAPPTPADDDPAKVDGDFDGGAGLRLVKQEQADAPALLCGGGAGVRVPSGVERTLLWVMPSTSGRVVSHQLTDKIKLFQQLKRDSDADKVGTLDTSKCKEIQL